MKNNPEKQEKARRFGAARLLLMLLWLLILALLIFLSARFLCTLHRHSTALEAGKSAFPSSTPIRLPEGLNINTATLEELDALPGIGPALANAILEYRAANQTFYFIEELMDVPGIGEKRFEALKPLIICMPSEP